MNGIKGPPGGPRCYIEKILNPGYPNSSSSFPHKRFCVRWFPANGVYQNRVLFPVLPFDVEAEKFVLRVNFQQVERDGEEFFTNAEEPAKFDHIVFDLSHTDIQHDIFDMPEVFAFIVLNLISNDGIIVRNFNGVLTYGSPSYLPV